MLGFWVFNVSCGLAGFFLLLLLQLPVTFEQSIILVHLKLIQAPYTTWVEWFVSNVVNQRTLNESQIFCRLISHVFNWWVIGQLAPLLFICTMPPISFSSKMFTIYSKPRVNGSRHNICFLVGFRQIRYMGREYRRII